PTQSGNYFCTVNSACGTQHAVYTRTGLNYITITILPLPPATMSGSSTICPGSSTTLNANTGTGLTYQWNLNGASISGATASSYTTSTLGSYTCTVSNSCGSTTSNAIVTSL